jgi:tripartite-type tricarboxylate transporter receptor subunit TctC
MKTLYSRLIAGAGILALGAAATFATPAQAIDFSGKTVKIIVPFKESGGASRYARLWQNFLKKELPGNPTVLVIYKPGGSGIKGANWFQKNAKPNGLTIAASSTSMSTSFLFGGKKVKYDLLSWRPIIMSPLGTQFYSRTELGVKGKNIADDIRALRKAKIITGAKNPTSSELRGAVAYDLLGIKNTTFVFGLNSGGRRKAVLRNELNISYDSAGSFMSKTSKYVKKGIIAHYMNLGFVNANGELVRDPAFPNTPTILEAYKAVNGGKSPSGPQWEAMKNLINIGVMYSKALILPAGTSDEIVNLYIKTIKKIMKDKKWKKLAKKELGNYPQAFGSEAAAILKGAIDIKPSTRAWIKKFLKKQYNYDMS